MSVARVMGIPCPDKDGTFNIKVEEVGGEIRLSVASHVFAKCLIKDQAVKVQLIDIDTGVVTEKNVQTLCWRR